jgi:hypothetical protein
MNPDLSRRIAWAAQWMPGMDITTRIKFYKLIEGAQEFSDLPAEMQALIVDIESQFGTNPNL